jgi:hypothetical protein
VSLCLYFLLTTLTDSPHRDELVEAVTSVGGPFMENEKWEDMTNLEHMTLETIPARFEVADAAFLSSLIIIPTTDHLHSRLL